MNTDTVILALLFVPWLVAAWAMVMMLVTALKDREDFTLGWLFGGSFVLERYNRKYLWIFGAAVAVDVGIGILVNVLYLTGRIRL
jgi:hypothetical protein